MFNALMKVQWKWTRVGVLFGVLLGFAIPVASVQTLRIYFADFRETSAGNVVQMMQQAGVLYAMLAAGVGLTIALLAWNADHKGRHIYALSLPVSRARYAGMRFAAGALFLTGPALGVLIGGLVATAVVTIPDGLHAYPIALAIRFYLSSFVAFAIFFAIAASSQRAAAITLGGVATVFLVAFALSAMGVNYDLLDRAGTLLFSEPGLLSVFTGRWMLIDV